MAFQSQKKYKQPLGVALGSLCAIISLVTIVAENTNKSGTDDSHLSKSVNINPDALKEIKADEMMLNYILMELKKSQPFEEHDMNNATN